MRAIAAFQHLTETQEIEKRFWDEATSQFVKRRAQIAAPRYDKNNKPILKNLGATIEVHHGVGHRYIAKVYGSTLAGFSSLHRAKNCIRRHFRIESRSLLRWTETEA